MRTILTPEMGGYRVWGQVWGGCRQGLGICAVPKAAGFGTEARHQLQSRGSSKRLGSLDDKPFRRLLQPENLSRKELVDVLREAVVDQKGPLVTLNKPQGLPVTGKPGELTLVSVLPELSQCLGLGERELQVVRASGKETSGLVLLSSCPQTASRLQKFFTHSQRARKPTATYCAVTDGIPAASEGKIQAALKVEHTDGASLAATTGSSREVSIQKGLLERCQVDPQPLPCAGLRLWLCPGPATATDSVPQPATGAHGPTALPCARGPQVLCLCGHSPGPALFAAS
ncbi:mitochondrial mRNA pseudouridine synthase RPUSD3 isoform X2 [Phacochoerus africanus]|uniref:mitochondrial mRNA pseudouridine synthase RPUSD3 isoform X2 n=1 Tax=Phacochoerus africanus TaxID=41426 RepID=UPI001FDA7637|nr:mitochondrial mRNA pseudouridine synthase RPUSD3 isoform X2 [Phacochoerus africanus]XP_047636570.1 mitochondrial mRNA pseudouridine synthase RPUSD3 isoform X2 [Phacochoerus africanus]